VSAPSLTVSELRVEFGGVKAVNDVSIASSGAALAIVGANGAGKTTLLNAVSGFVPVRSGRVAFDGAELNRAAARRVAYGVGRSFQHPHLMEDLTLEENVRGSRRGAARAEVRAAMAEFGLTDWVHRQIHELPYGIRKIADLLRAVLVGSRLLLCDEPAVRRAVLRSGRTGPRRDDGVPAGDQGARLSAGRRRTRPGSGDDRGRPVRRPELRHEDLRR
jgi:ABC-type branched-subunit amino acid transport system ATPase component